MGEAYLDQHLGLRHADTRPPGASACLADSCDVLHCAAAQKHYSARRRAPCAGRITEQLRARCGPWETPRKVGGAVTLATKLADALPPFPPSPFPLRLLICLRCIER